MDQVVKTLFSPFASFTAGKSAFVGARYFYGLPSGMALQQHFKPHAEELAAQGYAVSPEIPEGEFSQVYVLLSKNVAEARYDAARAIEILSTGGMIAVAGANDSGGRRGKKMLSEFGTENVRSHAANHACVAWGEKQASNDAVRKALEEGKQGLVAATGFFSQPGLFSWDRIDEGSAFLAAHLPEGLGGNGADFGCGYGFLARHVLSQCKEIKNFSCIDADHRAVEACRKNMQDVKIPVHYLWEDLSRPVTDIEDLDFIVMNPPFHEGKKTDPNIGKRFIRTACDSLRPGGQLWMVANMNLPYEKDIQRLFSSCRKVKEEKGFKVICAVR